MKTNILIKVCYTALIISGLFLCIAVDYLPLIVCWLPLLIAAFITLHYKPFTDHVIKKMNALMPLD